MLTRPWPNPPRPPLPLFCTVIPVRNTHAPSSEKNPPKSVTIFSLMVVFVRFARAARPLFSKTELSRDVFCARGRFAYTKHYLVTPILNLNLTREIRSPAPPHGAPFLCAGALAPAWRVMGRQLISARPRVTSHGPPTNKRSTPARRVIVTHYY